MNNRARSHFGPLSTPLLRDRPPPSTPTRLSSCSRPSPRLVDTLHFCCMSSSGRHVHRRRSHSASSPIRGAHLSDDPKWRLAVKRARPCSDYTRSPSYKDLPGADEPPEKWDVDQWRRGKRARRDTVSVPLSSFVPLSVLRTASRREAVWKSSMLTPSGLRSAPCLWKSGRPAFRRCRRSQARPLRSIYSQSGPAGSRAAPRTRLD